MEAFDTILERMKDTYEAASGIAPTEESDILIRLRVLAAEIQKLEASEDYILRQMFPTTAEGAYLDLHAAERGLTRRTARCASGNVMFYRDEGAVGEVLIPAGTEVATRIGAKRYVTDEDVVLPSDQNYVLAGVTAAEPGAGSNALGGNINIIVTPIAGIGQVNNGSVFTNGVDAENDEMLRERVLQSYREIPNGTNAAYYRQLALSVEGIDSAGVVGSARGAGTVNVYVAKLDSTVSADTLSRVQAVLSEQRELCVDVAAYRAEEVEVRLNLRIKVAAGYSFDAVASKLRQTLTDYIQSLGIGNDLRLSALYELIYHTEGVEDYRFNESYGADAAISESQYAVVGSLLIGEMSA